MRTSYKRLIRLDLLLFFVVVVETFSLGARARFESRALDMAHAIAHEFFFLLSIQMPMRNEVNSV